MPESFEKILDICITRITDGSGTLEDCTRNFPRYENELREILPLVVSLNALAETNPDETFSKNAGSRLAAKLPEQTVTFWGTLRHILTKPLIFPPRRLSMPQIIITVIAALSLLLSGTFGVQAAAPGDFF